MEIEVKEGELFDLEMNIESVPSEAGPDLDGIEQGMSNDEVEIASA